MQAVLLVSWLYLGFSFLEAPAAAGSQEYLASITLNFAASTILMFHSSLGLYWRYRLDGQLIKRYLLQLIIAIMFFLDACAMARYGASTLTRVLSVTGRESRQLIVNVERGAVWCGVPGGTTRPVARPSPACRSPPFCAQSWCFYNPGAPSVRCTTLQRRLGCPDRCCCSLCSCSWRRW